VATQATNRIQNNLEHLFREITKKTTPTISATKPWGEKRNYFPYLPFYNMLNAWFSKKL
jgi:hypothetical protein